MKRTVLFSIFACLPLFLNAADIPEVVIDDNKDNQLMCVTRAANDCISTVCPNSSDINCSDNCQADAQNKCQELSEE